MKYIILVAALLFADNYFAQKEKIKYANDLYDGFAYKEASAVYSDVVRKMVKRKDINHDVLLKAALSSYKSRNYAEAMKHFVLYRSENEIPEDIVFYYVDCLIRCKNFDQLSSDQSLSQLKDNLGQNVSEVKNIQAALDLKQMNYSLSDFGYNSDEGDYGAILLDDITYFNSSRKGLGYTHSEYTWDGFNYSNLFKIDTINNSAVIVSNASSVLHDGPIAFSEKDGKVYLTRTEFIKRGKDKIKHLKIYSSAYSKENGIVGDWESFKYNSDSYNIGHVCFSDDGETMFLVADMPGGIGGSDIYYSEFIDGDWSTLKNCGNRINTKNDELFPFMKDGSLYFSSNGYFGYGGLDIYRVDYEGKSVVENLGSGVNSSSDDFGFTVSNETNGYLSSDRTNGIDRIYTVRINEITGYLVLKPMDKLRRTVLMNPELYLIDRASNDTIIVQKNEYDEYVIPVKNRKDYIISGYKKDYELEAPIYLNTNNLVSNDSIEKVVDFVQTHYDLVVKTVVKGTGEICPEVTGVFIDPITKKKVHFVTDKSGLASVNVENHKDYDVEATKKGYLDLSESVYTDAAILIELDLKMEEIKKDMKFEIKNIFYDLAKWDLRAESTVELDKLVEFLKTNDNIKVELSSHTDSRASHSYNQTLSQKRAQSCVDYMILNGIPKDRIVAKGYGESQLVNHCSNGVNCSEEEHQANRRTEIKILSVNK